jgi:hypothetical protein
MLFWFCFHSHPTSGQVRMGFQSLCQLLFFFPNRTLSLSIIPCMHLQRVLVFFRLAPLLFSFPKSHSSVILFESSSGLFYLPLGTSHFCFLFVASNKVYEPSLTGQLLAFPKCLASPCRSHSCRTFQNHVPKCNHLFYLPLVNKASLL